MANINRIRVAWNGVGGLPGLSTFYVPSTETDVSDFTTFFNSLKGYFCPGLTWTIPDTLDTLNEVTGTLVGAVASTGGGTVTSSGSGNYGAGLGAFVSWATGVVINGRRLNGRTFLTNITSNYFDGSGTPNDTFRAAVVTAGTTLRSSVDMHIWHRPTPAAPSGGSSWSVVSVSCPDVVTALRSRRT